MLRQRLIFALVLFVFAGASWLGAASHDVSGAAAPDSVAAPRDSILSWYAAFESDAVLTYLGQEFRGPFEMQLEGDHLTINGVQVHLYMSLEDPLRGMELSPAMKLDRRADAAASFDEFVEAYDSSPLTGDFEVREDELTVRFKWVHQTPPYRCARVWRPPGEDEPEPPTREELLVSGLTGVARALEIGLDMWVRDGGGIHGGVGKWQQTSEPSDEGE